MKMAFAKTFLLSYLAVYLPLATAALDLIPEDIDAWTEQGVVLRSGPAGSWDEKPFLLKPVGVHKKDGVYYLFYLAGSEGCWDADADTRHQSVGLATSTDGVNFTKYSGNPVLKPHDFVPVESHEEGIRTAIIRYIPDQNMWLGFFGVESPGGPATCPFMGPQSQCSCNIPVDASIYAATSGDGQNWTVKGEVSGVYNADGAENYVDDFHFVEGTYHVWTHRAEGGQIHNASKGSDYMNLNPLGPVPELCWGWGVIRTFLHNDGNTVTALYDPNGGCAPSNENKLFFATLTLNDMTTVSNVRLVHNKGQRHNFLIKDTDSGLWRWYYNVTTGPDAGTIQLRTHPIASEDTLAPSPPTAVTAE